MYVYGTLGSSSNRERLQRSRTAYARGINLARSQFDPWRIIMHYRAGALAQTHATDTTVLSRPTLFVLAMSTPQSCTMLACWQMWMRRMMLHDHHANYEIHLLSYDATARNNLSDNDGSFYSASFLEAQVQKVNNVARFMHRMDENATVIMMDLDVMPLRPLSQLLAAIPPSREVTWMYNSVRHMPANAGFYLMRNTANVRALLDRWHARCLQSFAPDNNDQRILNSLLESLSRGALHWDLFPWDLVAGGSPWRDQSVDAPRHAVANRSRMRSYVTSSKLIAYHAIGHHSTRTKLLATEEILLTVQEVANAEWAAASGNQTHPYVVWQAPCNALAAEASCQSGGTKDGI